MGKYFKKMVRNFDYPLFTVYLSTLPVRASDDLQF